MSTIPPCLPCRLAAVCLALLATQVSRGASDDELMAIPVIVNIYQNSGTTKQQAEDAVNEASRMLKQLGVKLVIVDVKEGVTAGDDGAGGGTAGDSSFTQQEYEQVLLHGKSELLASADKKGLKIVFADGPNTDVGSLTNPTPGAATHREPVVFVKNQGDANTTGQSILHEFGHIVTLSEQHQISTTIESDDHGHAPNIPSVFGNENAMAPGNYRAAGGTPPTPVFSSLQIQKIRNDRVLESMARTVISGPGAPGVKKDQQDGIQVDPRGDHASGAASYNDLLSGTFTSSASSDSLQGRLLLGGLFPTTSDAFSEYQIDFESNPLFAGPENTIEIIAGSSGGSFFASGSLHHLPTDELYPISSLLTNAPINFDGEFDPLPMFHHLIFDVSKTDMGIAVGFPSTIDISITSINFDTSAIDDSLWMQMDMDRASDVPTLTLFAGSVQPLQLVPFEISGLTPDATFDFYLDGSLLFSDTLDPFGAFAGNFSFPALPPGPYFLTALDSQGQFAFNGLHMVPEPWLAPIALALGLILIVVRRRCASRALRSKGG